MGIVFDDEQRSLIECEDARIVGRAFAGAGKTTVAIAYANARPNLRFIYVCYGKANQMDAQRRFPAHVRCVTTHGLAFQAIGRLYKSRLIQNWKPRHVCQDMGLNIRVASAVHAVINNFLASERSSIEIADVLPVMKKFQFSSAQAEQIWTIACKLWSRMLDLNDTVRITHDVYLKAWVISRPQIDCDVILLDEAQDTNPVVSSLILAQEKARVVMIGDTHQSIFSFRGAKNAMEDFSASGATVIDLPRTWRFGPRTAMLCNALLSTYKKEKTRIIGMGVDDDFKEGRPTAFLARTNSQLFAMAAQCRGQGVYWVGGIENYKLDLFMDAYNLSVGKRSEINDPTMASYLSWADFVQEAKSSKDVEAKIIIDVVSGYGEGIPELISDMRFNEVVVESDAQRILTTAHKSKGFEWDYVRICEDFKVYDLICQGLTKSKRLREDVIQEINLLYVALTRAKSKVFLNADTKQMFLDIKAGKNPVVE